MAVHSGHSGIVARRLPACLLASVILAEAILNKIQKAPASRITLSRTILQLLVSLPVCSSHLNFCDHLDFPSCSPTFPFPNFTKDSKHSRNPIDAQENTHSDISPGHVIPASDVPKICAIQHGIIGQYMTSITTGENHEIAFRYIWMRCEDTEDCYSCQEKEYVA